MALHLHHCLFVVPRPRVSSTHPCYCHFLLGLTTSSPLIVGVNVPLPLATLDYMYAM